MQPSDRELDGDLEQQLHALDAELNRLRQEIWQVRHGLRVVERPEERLAELDARFHALGDQFLDLYRRWSASQHEMDEKPR